LSGELKTIAGKTYVFFTPEAGAAEPFVTVVVGAATGKSCSVSGSYKVTGTQATETTTAAGKRQTLTTSAAINTAVGTALKFGGKASQFNSNTDLELATHRAWSIDP
jgi:hypothetical protein